ncbi:hypothetical protein BDR06DRAFT_972495 [Suillus hirtellus]|nr:hypothetical protein BDR06DRAFT_972495 [Suillus hirtellus]
MAQLFPFSVVILNTITFLSIIASIKTLVVIVEFTRIYECASIDKSGLDLEVNGSHEFFAERPYAHVSIRSSAAGGLMPKFEFGYGFLTTVGDIPRIIKMTTSHHDERYICNGGHITIEPPTVTLETGTGQLASSSTKYNASNFYGAALNVTEALPRLHVVEHDTRQRMVQLGPDADEIVAEWASGGLPNDLFRNAINEAGLARILNYDNINTRYGWRERERLSLFNRQWMTKPPSKRSVANEVKDERSNVGVCDLSAVPDWFHTF